ncbi:hypothetical protein H2200_008997 [Cladophialophora chaetospira]|uniref:Uncharacterized protein n=1 Tax=Cladophialophora chaetospira TaxID=386627 RepID=A0AA39CG26_9EURO|nr:hypothetical protein H2200_008997 [Cladophialophora chaetospira]
MSRKHTLPASASRAKRLRRYIPFTKSKPEPEPEIIDMSVWRIGGPRGFRTDFNCRHSEDSQISDRDKIVDQDWVFVSRDNLIIPDDWEPVSYDDRETSGRRNESLTQRAHDREDEGLSSNNSSLDISSGESDDVPCVIPNFARRCHPPTDPNPLHVQQEQHAQGRSGTRPGPSGEGHAWDDTEVMEDSRISEPRTRSAEDEHIENMWRMGSKSIIEDGQLRLLSSYVSDYQPDQERTSGALRHHLTRTELDQDHELRGLLREALFDGTDEVG